MTKRNDIPARTVPGIPNEHAADAIEHLSDRLVSVIDLQLTLKHIHWNVVGPSFIGVHELLDQFTAETRTIVDEIAERIRVLGGVPRGRPNDVVSRRGWSDYSLDVASAQEHMRALDEVYEGILLDFRRAIVHVADADPVSEDMLIGHTATLEQQQWFVRSHLDTGDRPSDSADPDSADLDSAEAREVLTSARR